MEIKEKFKQVLWAFDKEIIDNQSLKCEIIADNFAISFLEFALDEFELDKSNYSLNKKDLLKRFKSNYENESQLFLITPKLAQKKYYFIMGKAIKYTKVKVIKITEVQYNTLKKLDSYNINVAQFIRDSIAEKIKREYNDLIPKTKKEFCPFQ